MGSGFNNLHFPIDRRIAEATRGNIDAYLDLGMAYSSGSAGTQIDLIEAHKWFNLAAVAGHADAQACRAEIASDMSPREIASAQAAARAWLRGTERRAA